MKYKHWIFDMDNTITESKSEMTMEMAAGIGSIVYYGGDVTIISGASQERMIKQIGGGSEDQFNIMSQCGNVCKYWKNKLSREQKKRILKHIAILRTDYSYIFKDVDESDLIQDRGSQITFSFTGHNADKEKKAKFDPTGAKRTNYLDKSPFEDEELCVKVGGGTSIDYTFLSGTKGKNLERFIKKMKWKKEDCVYIGDAIREKGNDETVIGVIPNLVSVNNPDDTLKVIEKLLNE